MDNGGSEEIQVDLLRAVKAVIRQWPILLCITCIAGCMGYVVFSKANSSYFTTNGKIYVIDREETGFTLSIEDLDVGSQLVEDYKELIKSRFVLERVIKRLELGITYEDLLPCVSVNSPIDTRIIEIEVKYEKSKTAQSILNTIEIITCNDLAYKLGTEHPTIVEKACETVKHYKYSPVVKAIEIMFITIFLLSGLIGFADMINMNIRYKEDVVQNLDMNLIGRVSYVSTRTMRKVEKARK